MLKPKVNVEKFEKFGFKKCEGEYGKNDCYYLCVARDGQLLFVSKMVFLIEDWRDGDPRIHTKPNCRYQDRRDSLDILYELIKADMLTKVEEGRRSPIPKGWNEEVEE